MRVRVKVRATGQLRQGTSLPKMAGSAAPLSAITSAGLGWLEVRLGLGLEVRLEVRLGLGPGVVRGEVRVRAWSG